MRQGHGSERCWTTSAPAKVILLGEHAVNRGQAALATAVGPRATCMANQRDDDLFVLTSGAQRAAYRRDELADLRHAVDGWRAANDTAAIRRLVRSDFFAPTRYVLSLFLHTANLPGLEITWRSEIAVGSGLGSGAAANAALIVALCRAAGTTLAAAERARLAWQGDILAHGGLASGLDSSAVTFGGVVRYTVAEGAQALALPPTAALPLVIGDTGVRAITAEVNGRVSAWLAAHPADEALFPAIGGLVAQALAALQAGDMAGLGRAMDSNQAMLRQIGVSSPEIEQLIAAAHSAGALGAKLTGSGGGGIVLALATPGGQEAIAAAITAAGGRAIIAEAAVQGARDEAAPL